MDQTEQIIKEAYGQLPPVIQNIISDSGWEDKVRKITQKYGLHIDQGMVVEDETLLVMLGLEPVKEYIDNLEKNAELTREQAEQISDDVEIEIFKEIRNKLIDQTIDNEVNKSKNPIEKPWAEETEKDYEHLDRKNILGGIEDPEPETKEEDLPDSLIQNIGSQEHDVNKPPSNLPVGNIADVPKHGHNHQDVVGHKLNNAVSTETETVTITDEDDGGEKKESVKYKKVDPYREPVE